MNMPLRDTTDTTALIDFSRVVTVTRALGIVIGLSVIIGWAYEIAMLKSILPGYITMKANTAIGFILISLALFGFQQDESKKWRNHLACTCATLVLLIGGLTMAEYLFNVNLGIDELIFTDAEGIARKFPPGRLAPITAFNFILCGFAVLLTNTTRRPRYKTAQVLAFIAFLTSFQGLIGYLCGVNYTFGVTFYAQMALHTAVAFSLLSLGLLCAMPNDGLMAVFTARTIGGHTARRLIFASLFVPPLVNWLQIVGLRYGLYDADFSVLFRIVGNILFFTWIVWRNSNSLHHTDLARSHAEKERQALQDQLQTIIAQAPIFMFTLDESRRFVFFEGQAMAKLGLTTKAVVGHSLEEIFASIGWITEGVNQGFSGKASVHEGALRNGIYEIHLNPLYNDSGKVTRVAGLAMDISARKLAEQISEIERQKQTAQESIRAKTQFLANMSHEIRTPLTGVIGMVNLLSKTQLTKQQKEYVMILERSGKFLMSVVNDVLDFSKIDAKKMDFQEVDFSIMQAVEDVRLSLLQTAKDKGLEIRLEMDKSMPPLISGDPSRICQVLTNLLGNAIKFTSSGHITVTLQRLATHEGRVTARIIVSDTGIGLSRKSIEKLFNPFAQADASVTQKYGGTGLGLSISKLLTEQMGGEIGVNSIEGKGSSFWFTIVAKVPEASTAQALPQALPSFSEFNYTRVLVVDDIEVNRLIASTMLKNAGLIVDCVDDGESAIVALDNFYYDIALMDCHMPVLSGYEATRRIRQSNKQRLRHMPIIAMTASAMQGDREKCLAAQMDDYISKPLDENLLLEKVRQWLPPSALDMTAKDGLMQFQSRPGLQHDLIKIYLSSAPKYLIQLQEAHDKHDVKQMEYAAHTLKSMSYTVGATPLSKLCEQAEIAGRKADVTNSALTVEKILDEYHRVRYALNILQKNQRSSA